MGRKIAEIIEKRKQAQATVTYERPWIAGYQRDAFWCPARYSLIEASTKSGKTVGGMLWLLEQALFGKWMHCWWIAPVYGQAEIAYRRMKDGLPVQEGGIEIRQTNDSKMTITLPNRHTIWFKSGERPDNLYGEDVGAAVGDECSRMREEAWHVLRTTLTATGGPVRLVGNVKGRKNWFYRLARRAEAGDVDMHYARITAHDAVSAGIITAADVADAKRLLPANVFRELYLAEPSDDAGNPFGISHVHACLKPLSPEPPEAWGIDLAKSVDWTVAIALDRYGDVCRFERWQGPWELTIAKIVALIGDKPALVDSTGVGDPVLEALQKRGGRFTGYNINQSSKQHLMERLAVAVQQRAISFPDGPILHEMESFEYVLSRTGVYYSAPTGMHDDCVIALALAVWARGKLRHQPSAQYAAIGSSNGRDKHHLDPWAEKDGIR